MTDWLLGLRRKASSLLANGHPLADRYPLGTLILESDIVDERVANAEITRSVLLQQAVLSILSKEGGAQFKRSIESLNVELKGKNDGDP